MKKAFTISLVLFLIAIIVFLVSFLVALWTLDVIWAKTCVTSAFLAFVFFQITEFFDDENTP